MSSRLEDDLYAQIVVSGLPRPEREYRFHPVRRWRFDLAWPALKLAAEVEGGTFVAGRHSRGAGYRKDCEKYNAAVIDCGWQVVRFDSTLVRDGSALATLERALREEQS